MFAANSCSVVIYFVPACPRKTIPGAVHHSERATMKGQLTSTCFDLQPRIKANNQILERLELDWTLHYENLQIELFQDVLTDKLYP